MIIIIYYQLLIIDNNYYYQLLFNYAHRHGHNNRGSLRVGVNCRYIERQLTPMQLSYNCLDELD